MRRSFTSLAVLVQLGVTAAHAQELPRYFPLDHRTPGKAAAWNTVIDPSRCGRIQPVEITTPGGGEVTVLNADVTAAAPVQADLEVGRSYRLRISNLTDFPGIEVYPSIEMLDHLHAPPGLEKDFAVPIEITAEDVEAALQNRLVTKVVYLEQPDIAIPKPQSGGLHTTDFAGDVNLLEAADYRGRPIAIIRLGGRQPDLHNPDPAFLGNGRAVQLSPVAGKVHVTRGTKTAQAHRPVKHADGLVNDHPESRHVAKSESQPPSQIAERNIARDTPLTGPRPFPE